MTESNGKMSARDAILASIRDNLEASAPFDAVRREHYDHSASVASAAAKPVFSQAELIENFRANLESLGAHCTIVAGQKAAAETIVAIINKRGARRIAISDSELVKSV